MTEVVFVRGEDVLSIMKYLKKNIKNPMEFYFES